MTKSTTDKFVRLVIEHFYGFLLMGGALTTGLAFRQLGAEVPGFVRTILLIASVGGFIGQFIVSWRRSKGIQVLILINLALFFVLGSSQIAQLITAQISLAGLILYMYPSILLFRRNHRRKYLLAVVNFFAGVYVIPWVLLLRVGLKLPRISSKRFH